MPRVGIFHVARAAMSAEPPAVPLPALTREEILERLRRILVEQFEVEAAQVRLAARFREDLDIDSIDVVDLVLELRKLTGLALEPRQFRGVETVAEAVELVHGLLVAR